MSRDAPIARLAERLRTARRVTVVTGAGVSAASGVPTFRGSGGLWKNFRVEELATLAAFDRDPRLVWEWYEWRRGLVAAAQPNRAHEVLAAWSRRLPSFHLITQNVDGLHERAGTANVIRFHGSLWEVSCRVGCGRVPPRWREDEPFDELPPRCPGCRAFLRPAVTWFGEAIDPGVLASASEALGCDVCIAVGTSAVVYPAAGLVTQAGALGAFTAEINPDTTPASRAVDVAIAAPAEAALDRLDRLLDPS